MALKHRLVVDPIRCDGRGTCAELFPERVTLDDWGYPIVSAAPIPRSLLRDARRAVQLCPVMALRLEEVSAAEARPPAATPRPGTQVRPPVRRRTRVS